MLHPNGGVTEPMAHCTVTIIPKCIGSIPAATAGPTNIGAKIIIATSWSTNIQATKKNKLAKTKILIGPASGPNKVAVNNWGTLAKENIQAKAFPAATKTNTTEVTTPEDKATLGTSFIVIDL